MVFLLASGNPRATLPAMLPPLSRSTWIGVLLALALGHPVQAQTGDPMAAFLAERGFTSTAAPAWRDRAAAMVVDAMSFLGVPYRRGGNRAEEGFDCSGFTRHLFALNLGLDLPRRSYEQAGAASLMSVGRQELLPGDLVFFNTLQQAFSHVGIYVGNGRFIHSPKPGAAVRIEDMQNRYWERRFDGARRAVPPSGLPPAPAIRLMSAPVASGPDHLSGVGH
jgi:cell wall-associated NlpC family hydrolase